MTPFPPLNVGCSKSLQNANLQCFCDHSKLLLFSQIKKCNPLGGRFLAVRRDFLLNLSSLFNFFLRSWEPHNVGTQFKRKWKCNEKITTCRKDSYVKYNVSFGSLGKTVLCMEVFLGVSPCVLYVPPTNFAQLCFYSPTPDGVLC